MIVDDLTLEKKIGSGAFGEVYITSKKGDTKTKYATKQIERAEVEKGEGLKYLRNEIVILSYLKHPNIVKFVEVKFKQSIENEEKIKKLTGATARCIKHKAKKNDKCFFSNEQATDIVYFARSY